MSHADFKVIDGGATESLERGSKEWGARIRKETRLLSKQLDTGYMKLAERLWQIYDTPVDGDPNRGSICTSWGFSDFNKYVEGELGLHYKKGQRLLRVWKILNVDLQLEKKTLQRFVDLGFSKVRELTRPGVLTSRNVDAWVRKAEEMSYLKLAQSINKYLSDKETEQVAREAEESFNASRASSSSSTRRSGEHEEATSEDVEEESSRDRRRIEGLEVSTKQLSCLLIGDQIETVNLALKRASELSDSDKVGHNLSLICLDFLSTNDFKFANEEQKLRFLVKFEKLLGYKFIIVDAEADDVVYGINTLEKLAKGK